MARRRKKTRTSKKDGGGKPRASAVPSPPRSERAETTVLPRRRLGIGLAIAAALALGLGLWIFRERRSGAGRIEARPLNVILVTADTLRADKLGCYGNGEIATPNLDRLAQEGVVFENASTAVPVTLPSHASILTGTYPVFHGVHENGARALEAARTTLAEVLKARGYQTGAFVGAFVLDSRWGLDQGFDRYVDDFGDGNSGREAATRRRGEDVLNDALAWMDSVHDQRFFSWIHFFDPHAPYDPPEPFRGRYANDTNSLYDGEVAYVDSLMGRLLEWIDKNGLSDWTLVVFLADHGESLGEHGELTHGFFLYDATMRVPFLLRAPSRALRGLRIPAQVRTIDVMPTVLELLGIETPGEVQGASLLPLLTASGSEEERVALGESTFPSHYGWSPLESLRTREELFVSAPRPELYDVTHDPGAERNLASAQAATVREMETRLKEIRERYRADEGETRSPLPLDEETRRKLAALGYLGGASSPTPDATKALADPKDKIELFNLIRAAAGDLDAARWQEAIDKLQRVASSDPDVVEAQTMLGRAYFSSGDWTRAADAYQRALSSDPSYVTALFGLASTYQKLGRLDDAAAGLHRVLALEPRFTGAALSLAQIEMGRQKFRDALSILEKAEVSERERAAVQNLEAECYLQLKDFEAALRAYQQVVEVSPRDHLAHFNIAKLLGQMGKQDEMIAELQKSIEADPSFTVGHLYLANAYLDRGNLEQAVELAQKGIALGPEPSLAPFGHFILADAYDQLGRKQDAAREMQIAQQLQSAIH